MEKLAVRSRGFLSPRRTLWCSFGRWGSSSRSLVSLPSQQRGQQQQQQHRRLLSSSASRLTAAAGTAPASVAVNSPRQHSHQDRFKLPATPCRTRFAPSPTGYLHLGSLRTALYNYLLAKGTGGQFILRIEDTDQTRLVGDAEKRLFEDLEWLGLTPDEGPNNPGPYGPYRQSERLPLYHEHSDRLIREGKAYRCFCTPESLEEQKALAAESNQPTNYPGTCRGIPLAESDARASKGEKFAVRFKSAAKPIMIKDIVYSRFQKKDPEEDFIIMKRDGFPTYHFANVVDDHLMEITHVIRGSEWLVSTPKHVEMYNALGWEPPQFAHLGLLVDSNRQKLSKRDNSANMEFYKHGHILPAALLNFAALLGWRPPNTAKKHEVMTLNEMAENFSLKFSKGDIMVSLLKLPFLQEKHLEHLATASSSQDPADAALLESHLLTPLRTAINAVEEAKSRGETGTATPTESLGPRLPHLPLLEDDAFRSDLIRVVLSAKLPLSNPADRFALAVSKLRYYIWEVPPTTLRQTLQDGKIGAEAPPERAAQLGQAVAYLGHKLAGLDEGVWNTEVIDRAMRETMADEAYWGLFGGATPNADVNVYKPLRWALVGMDKGMPLARTIEVLGREETLRRLEVARGVAEDVAAETAGGEV